MSTGNPEVEDILTETQALALLRELEHKMDKSEDSFRANDQALNIRGELGSAYQKAVHFEKHPKLIFEHSMQALQVACRQTGKYKIR